MLNHWLGVDIGGTFTDFVLVEPSGKLRIGKRLTTPHNPTEAVLEGVTELFQEEISSTQIGRLVHGTTLVTNAIIERKGAKTGLITTEGFEDVLEIGNELRYDIYDLFLEKPAPIVPRRWRKGVPERMDYLGRVVRPLDTEKLLQAVDSLVSEGVDSIAISFLHSFKNPHNEQRARAAILARHPRLFVSLSSDILPEIREYERTNTTALNAYVQPITDKYLMDLKEKLSDAGYKKNVYVMLASGHLTSLEYAKRAPISMVESGPAGGAMAGVYYGNLVDTNDLLCFDMGGTTAKACLIQQGQPTTTTAFEAARVRRFVKGSGLPIKIPVIDMIEIGAGGGSIASLDSLGLLKVGPQSAGAMPGPACYDRGGSLPTVTDADLVLGYLDPEHFLGGTMRLNSEASRHAIEEHVARPLKVTVVDAAQGIHRMVCENMANAARAHLLEKGKDPRRYAMLAFGGAGPVHAVQVAKLLKVSRVFVPVGAGVMSSLGFLTAPVAVDFVQSYLKNLDEVDWEHLNQVIHNMELKGFEFMESAEVPFAETSIERTADMRYVGQGHEISVPIPSGLLGPDALTVIKGNFYETYEKRFGRVVRDMPIEAVSWRVRVEGQTPELNLNFDKPTVTLSDALKKHRLVYFVESGGYVETPVYNRYHLAPRIELLGPCIVEENESTLVVPPGSRIEVDDFLNIHVRIDL